jgi:hypothetical protein
MSRRSNREAAPSVGGRRVAVGPGAEGVKAPPGGPSSWQDVEERRFTEKMRCGKKLT